jgi:trans-aconitate methyltransferase
MPYSNSSFDVLIANLLRRWSYRYYLDIGPGAGKYGKLIRWQFPEAYIEALEPNQTYVSHFNLAEIYDHVAVTSAIEIVDSNPDYHTECVIIGDCIEHMKKSEGVDLLHYLLYRSKRILVAVPDKYIQYSWQGQASEAHRSAWGRRDFKALKHRWHAKGYMRLAVIDGYLGDPKAVVNPATKELLQTHRPLIAG